MARRAYKVRRRPVKRRGQESGVSVKAVVFVLVIAFSLAMRFASTGPLFEVREKVAQVLAQDADFGEAVQTLGRMFKGDGDNDDNAVLVFGRMILGLDDGEAEEKDSEETEPTSGVMGFRISDTTAGDISGLTVDIADCVLPEEDGLFDLGFEEEEIYDGTPNEAFKIPSPDAVDDGVYNMDFRHVMPVASYRVSSKYGYRVHPISGNTTFHYGVDLAAASGTKVVSVADGTVSETGYGSINGNYIKITHADGFVTHYAHLKSIGVKKGQKVKAGEKIGAVGSTGYSTGPHLHFEVRKNGLVVNPFDNFSF